VVSPPWRHRSRPRVSRHLGYKIGLLGATAGPLPSTEAFRQGLRERGWIEGQNITIEYRWAAGKIERVLPLAEELVKLGTHVIVVPGNKAILFAKQATSTIPIVMAFHSTQLAVDWWPVSPAQAEM
jgi:putative tryptophan/tyrosine transport system substrate-binding protein